MVPYPRPLPAHLFPTLPHSRDTTLVLRREGLVRHHSGHGPHGEMSQQTDAADMKQDWVPRKGAKSTKGGNRRGNPPNTTRRRGNERAACAREAERAEAEAQE